MQYALSVNFEGPVSERETEARRSLSLAGSGEPPESTDLWQLRARFAWARTPSSEAPSGQIEVQAPMTAVLRGSLRSGTLTTVTDERGTGQAWMFELEFSVDESTGWFADAQGSIRLYGTVRSQGFQLTADLDLDLPRAAWAPPNSGPLSDVEAASGLSHVGPNPLHEEGTEIEAEKWLQGSAGNDRLATRAPAPAKSLGAGRLPMRGEEAMTQREQEGHHPPGVTTGSPERPAETMAASEMVFDLASELQQLHRERSWTTGERNGKTLVREPDFRVVLTAMPAGMRLAEHEADARLTIQTVQGHLRVRLSDRVVDLPLNHLLALDRNVRHDVEAEEDSAFLLTLAWPGAGGDRHEPPSPSAP
ncbi:MAG: hypothetical protein ACR2PL_24585 [Dehalococcoidia bacterium]